MKLYGYTGLYISSVNFEKFLSFMPENMTKVIIFSFKKGCLIKPPLFYIISYEKKCYSKKIKGKRQLGKPSHKWEGIIKMVLVYVNSMLDCWTNSCDLGLISNLMH